MVWDSGEFLDRILRWKIPASKKSRELYGSYVAPTREDLEVAVYTYYA